jgi:cytochrome d ubiquinol oxidase subunit I
MVALGTLFSSFWILAANSWMQTPAGYSLVDGRFFPVSWTAIIFNPSFPYRLAHTVCGFYVTTAFVVLGVAAGLVRKRQFEADGRVIMSTTLWLLLVLVPLQILLGDAHGLNTREYQPAKLAAIEARWETGSRIPLTLFAIPDQKNATNHFAIEIPVLGSLILTHDPNGTVRGLKEWPADQRATVIIPFFAFRIMVGLGLVMLAITLIGAVLRFGGRLWRSDWFLRACQWSAPIGFLAVLAGWTTTEAGRQPWTVYGLMRTADSVTPSLTTADVAISFAGYAAVYLLMFPAGFLIMRRLIRAGTGAPGSEDPVQAGRPSRPVDALPGAQPEGEAS